MTAHPAPAWTLRVEIFTSPNSEPPTYGGMAAGKPSLWARVDGGKWLRIGAGPLRDVEAALQAAVCGVLEQLAGFQSEHGRATERQFPRCRYCETSDASGMVCGHCDPGRPDPEGWPRSPEGKR